MRVLVTGGAGFIGSNLVRRLVAAGDHVRVLDDLSTGNLGNLEELDGSFTFIRGDIRNAPAVRQAVDGVDVVYHLAALPSVARSVADPIRSNAVNVEGTLNVLVAARAVQVRRVVYASSSSVYGNTLTLPKHEEMPSSPLSPYAAAKLAGESYCRAFASVYGLSTVSLRLFNVFGPRQDPGSEYAAVVPRFIARMLAGESPVIFGDGGQSRDFTFVANAVEACLLAGSAGQDVSGEFMNIACGDRISLVGLVGMLNGILRTDLPPALTTPRPGDVRHSQASIEKAHRILGYEPVVDIRQGLVRTVEWFRMGRQPIESGMHGAIAEPVNRSR